MLIASVPPCFPSTRAPLQDYEAALDVAPKHVTALYRKGQVLLALNKHEVSATLA
jgi:hypothetical protein